MPTNFKDYFYFNRSERKGIISLSAIILLILLARQYFISLEPQAFQNSSNLDSLMQQIQFRVDRLDSVEKAKKRSQSKSLQLSNTLHFFDFDPNDFPVEKWREFGLTEKQAEVIKRYEASGGNFRTKKDVKKMFVISDALYRQLEQHILLPDTMIYEEKKFKKSSKEPYKKFVIDINRADTADLKKLYGIGSVLSKRIVDYREKLGGFYAKEQLKKVYGLREEVLSRLDSQLVLSPIVLRRMNINKATAEELKAHPLINWKIANTIVKYRDQHGPFKNLDELKKIVLIDEELLKDLRPYLEI